MFLLAKKKKQKIKLPTSLWFLVILIVIGLGAFGIEIPSELQSLIFQNQPKQVQQSKIIKDNHAPKEQQQTSFTKEELKNQQKPWIKYHGLDHLGRPTGADALLKKELIGTGTGANQKIRPPGFVSGLEPYFHSRGHLIGRQLGGSGDDARNLVTLYQTPVNTPYMTKYENMVRQAVDNGETVRYRVTPIYNGNELMCSEIKIEAQSLSSHPKLHFTAVIKNAQKEDDE